jgi:peptidoglycan hydrolase-like protein with peptidoglycan-binding domain
MVVALATTSLACKPETTLRESEAGIPAQELDDLRSCAPIGWDDQRAGCVRMLQHVLRIRGAAMEQTGRYLNETTDRVKQFQAVRGLPENGVADHATLSQLIELPHGNADWDLRRECLSLSRGDSGGPDSQGRCVTALRRRLNAHGAELPDGDRLDEPTGLAVRAFQMTAGLEAKGVVGPQTKKALYAPLPPRSQPRVDPACRPSGCALYLSRSTTKDIASTIPSDRTARFLLAAGVSLLACWQVKRVPGLGVACQPVVDYIIDQLVGTVVLASEQNACLVVNLGYPPGHKSWSPLSVGVSSGPECYP